MLYNQVMETISEEKFVQNTVDLLCKWLECEPSQVRYEPSQSLDNREIDYKTDLNIIIRDIMFIVEFKQSGDLSSVTNGIRYLSDVHINHANTIKLLVVPYMHELGRKHCKEAGISWLDLSGNANITGPGIRIIIEGQPNLFKRPGRSTNVFAPKSSRVSRFLLYHQGEAFSQREIAKQTELGEGHVSKIVRAMETQELIERYENGYITIKNPNVLLDAWLEKYDFSKHNPIRGYIPARSGLSLMQNLSDSLTKESIKYAVTGLGAAWLYTHFASFRTVTLYISETIKSEILSLLDFSEVDSGSNTIFVVPNDGSIFWDVNEIEGIKCVHSIQTYLDLNTQPERAQEAMPEIRRMILRP